ncbi:MAG TPA: hypothetical protein VFP86_00275 [bacterium]|nr:hypothetical protein [bacterium]
MTILLTILGVGFIARMNLQQRLVGDRLRAMEARYIAEAGVEKVIWYLDGRAPDGSDDASWRPLGYREHIDAGGLRGEFTVDVRDLANDFVSIVSWGQAGGARSGVRVTAKIAPRVLDHALFSAGLVAIEGPRAGVTLIGPAGQECLPRVLIGVNAELWFRTRGSSLELGPSCPGRSGALQLGLADIKRLTVGDLHQPIAGADRLRSFGVNVTNLEEVTLRPIEREAVPYLDAGTLRRQAVQNVLNAALNQAAGRAMESPGLASKRNSLYTPEEISALFEYIRRRDIPLVGPIVVAGPVTLPGNANVTVAEGFLAAEGGLTLQPGSRLTIHHEASSRLLPGVITLTRELYAPLIVGEGASLAVEGVVVAEGVIEMHAGSTMTVVGAVVASDEEYGLRLDNATLVVRYDPAVRGALGVLAGKGRRRVVPLAWHEMR